MNNILKEIDIIFQTISSIPVTGDSIDKMAVARAKLKNLYATIQNMKKEVPSNEGAELQG